MRLEQNTSHGSCQTDRAVTDCVTSVCQAREEGCEEGREGGREGGRGGDGRGGGGEEGRDVLVPTV